MKTVIARLVVMVAFVAISASASRAQTLTWQVVGGKPCQGSAKAPNYYCVGYDTDTNGDLDEYVFYEVAKSDGTFTGGTFTEWADFEGKQVYFNSSNFTGTVSGNVAVGRFSGALADGRVFTGSATFNIGPVKLCAGRYGCHMVSGIVGGTVTLTVQ